MAELDGFPIASSADQYRHQFIVLRDKCLVCIHVNHVDIERVCSLKGLQCQQHVFAKMAVRPRVKNQLNQGWTQKKWPAMLEKIEGALIKLGNGAP
jgi:hypothetical protein